MSENQPQPRSNPASGRGGHTTGTRSSRPSRGPDQRAAVARALAINESSGVPFGHVPAYLPGSSSLVEELDKRVLIVLRDGKHLIGNLASFDQFSNLVLLETVERRIVRLRDKGTIQCFYYDLPLGTFMVRGDSMVLMGAVDDDAPWLSPVSSLDELLELQKIAEPAIEWDFDGDLIA